MKRTFSIKACWDDKAKVYYSESDIKGLHIEAATLDEFECIMKDLAVDLVIANHIEAPDFANKPMRELIPAILWQRPDDCAQA